MIDACLKLHGQLCPPEFISFQSTLESFFQKNFSDDIRRLNLDTTPAAIQRERSMDLRSSSYEQSLRPSTSTVSTMRAFVIPPLNLGRPLVSPAPMSPSSSCSPADAAPPQQTPLQKHLAHLARHGIHGVSSAPADAARHVGDLGNVASDENGVVKLDIEDKLLTLNGPLSIVGQVAFALRVRLCLC